MLFVIHYYPISGTSNSGKARLAAEEWWLNFGRELGKNQVFRLGGIYGPGRRNIYNIVDDDPAPREEVFSFARNLVEKKWPSQTRQLTYHDSVQSSIRKASSRSEKRVLNTHMKKELGVQLLHRSYRSGLQSILEHLDPSPYTQVNVRELSLVGSSGCCYLQDYFRHLCNLLKEVGFEHKIAELRNQEVE